jgi:hypothetical protein
MNDERTVSIDGAILRAIQDHAVQSLATARFHTTNLHVHTKVLPPGAVIKANQQQIRIEEKTILVFADDAPTYNWGHPCRYLLYAAESRYPKRYKEVPAQFPPFSRPQPDYLAFHQPVAFSPQNRLWPLRPQLLCPISFPVGQRYAILYAGNSDNRHTNDLEFLYRTLRDLYGFADDNIYCLNHDGTLDYNNGPHPIVAWPGDNTPYRMPVKGKGTKADLEAVLDDVKKRLTADDLLLIHTNNHGGYDGPGQANLCALNWGTPYYAADFAAKLAGFPKYHCLMVMMEQCHSGGFNAPIIAASTAALTTVASAVPETMSSNGGPEFDPFARDWISAMAKHTPYGASLAPNPDADGDGKIDAEEAFNYADAVHDPVDLPVYSETSEAAGDSFLGQRYETWWWWCPLLVQQLQPVYAKLPPQEFYDRLHRGLAPRLGEIQNRLDAASDAQRNDVLASLKQLVASAF